MTAPHVHTIEEAKANIKRIEHNATGHSGPAGKKAGPPSGASGGSAKNRTSGNDSKVISNDKGADWVSKRKP